LGVLLKQYNILKRKILSDVTLNNDIHPNRGVEFILNGGKRKDQPKTFQVMFGKMVRFFNREIHLHFEFSLDFKKDIPKGE